MPNIDIRRRHNRKPEDARAAVDRIAAHIAEKFEVDCAWTGDVLEFSRAGVDGHIALEKNEIHVYANLGFLLSMLKTPIEAEIQRYLDREFA